MGGEVGANHNAVGFEENCWREIPFPLPNAPEKSPLGPRTPLRDSSRVAEYRGTGRKFAPYCAVLRSMSEQAFPAALECG